jgi:hypothetical protein
VIELMIAECNCIDSVIKTDYFYWIIIIKTYMLSYLLIAEYNYINSVIKTNYLNLINKYKVDFVK